jgi:hypothetical protein
LALRTHAFVGYSPNHSPFGPQCDVSPEDEKMSFLIAWLVQAVTWAFDMLLLLPLHLWVLTLGGLQAAVNAIPVPGFFADAGNYVAQMPPLVAFISAGFQIPYGLGVITTAFVARWILRRIPLIG